MNRRDFLVRTGLTAGALSLGDGLLARAAHAAGETDHYFVFCYYEGGWDQLLALDPRDPAEFNEGNLPETGIQPAYERLPPQFSRAPIDAGPFRLGPCVGELAQLGEHFSLMRGLNMATLTHEVGRRYLITGRPPSGLTAPGSPVYSRNSPSPRRLSIAWRMRSRFVRSGFLPPLCFQEELRCSPV